MIRIGTPIITKSEDYYTLSCRFIDEAQGIDETIWYRTSVTWGRYFVDEVADPYLVLALLLALKFDEDIEIEAPVSEQLYYNTIKFILPLLAVCYHKTKTPKLTVSKTIKTSFTPQAIATGCSLGIDSLSAITQHIGDKVPNGYRLSHLTYFNTGALGTYDLDAIEKSYLKDYSMVEAFSKEIGLPIVSVSTNVHLLYKTFDFNSSHTMRNMSIVLAMQKLFKRYLYSSTYDYAHYKLSKKDLAYFEDPILARLSTESTSIMSADAHIMRSSKTEMLAGNPLTKKHLYVCLREQTINDRKGSWTVRYMSTHDKGLRNCGHCMKCLRTMVTLDICGCLEDYRDIFDVDYYYWVRKYYMAKILGRRKRQPFLEDIYAFMKEKDYQIPFVSRLLAPVFMIKSTLLNIILNRIFKFT